MLLEVEEDVLGGVDYSLVGGGYAGDFEDRGLEGFGDSFDDVVPGELPLPLRDQEVDL